VILLQVLIVRQKKGLQNEGYNRSLCSLFTLEGYQFADKVSQQYGSFSSASNGMLAIVTKQ